ncbi:MAG: tyrosine-type recombinase/integrase [Streptosporangiaceae bacterium]
MARAYTVAQVCALADATGPRYRALVLLACFCGLRWGELAALRRCDIDIEAGTVRVARQLTEVLGQPPMFGPPKSDAGRRTVIAPAMIPPDISSHLASFTEPGADALLFTSPGGKPLRHSNFRSRIWMPALAATGLPGIHFHDLRHAGNLFTSTGQGASLRELMERSGTPARGLPSSTCTRPATASGAWRMPWPTVPARNLESTRVARVWHERARSPIDDRRPGRASGL